MIVALLPTPFCFLAIAAFTAAIARRRGLIDRVRPYLLDHKREVGRFPDFARCRLQLQPQDRLAGGCAFGDSHRVVV